MPCYSLYLSTQSGSPSNPVVIDKTKLSNVNWRVDFNSLMGKDIYDYKFCRVRYHLIGETFTAAGTPANDWTNYNGYLAVTLPSTFNGTTTAGTILGLLSVTDSPITGTGVHCMLASTMSDCGVDINLRGLIGVTDMRVTFTNWVTNQPNATAQDYMLYLNFELYN